MLRDDSVNRLKNRGSMRDLAVNDRLTISRNGLQEDRDENDLMFPLENDDIYMIDRADLKTNVKKGFFSMIDNVLGGAQSKNINMISNTYNEYQQFETAPQTVKPISPHMTISIMENEAFGHTEISPTIMKQQKFEGNTTMMSSNYVNSFNFG